MRASLGGSGRAGPAVTSKICAWRCTVAIAVVGIGAMLPAPVAGGATPTGAVATVPTQFRSAYAAVEAEVQSFAREVPAPPAHAKATIGTELLSANGNIGATLLAPNAITGVENELDAFQSLGIKGVTVDVSFPLLLSSTAESSGYLRYYEQVANQVKRRHMVLSVEENPIFAGTPLTSLQISYVGLTLPRYANEQREQAQTIIDHLHPNYLTVLDEPDTFTDALGIDLNSPTNAVQVVSRELAGLRREGTKVGAGTGTWSPTSIDEALLAHTSVDYLDVHVYPLGPQQLSNLRADTAAAKADHKPLVMDETWLNKPTATEGSGPAGAPAELKEKSYSFWEPLDEEYLTAMYSYVGSQGYSYVSFFDGARAFFGYLPWSPQLEAATYRSFTSTYNRLVAVNMRQGHSSGTGQTLAHLLPR